MATDSRRIILTSTRSETHICWRTGAGLFSTLLSANYPHLLISKSLSADMFPAASSCIKLFRNSRKTRITCSKELTMSLSQLVVSLLFTRGKIVSKNTSECNFCLCTQLPGQLCLLCKCIYAIWDPKIKICILPKLMAEIFWISVGQLLEKGLFLYYKLNKSI